MENDQKSIFSKKNIQEYIYLSYLYLLIVGALSYSIYYAFLGINIISYSNVLDILLSPIIILTDNIKTPLFMFGYILIILLVIIWFEKRNNKALKKDIAADKEMKLRNTIKGLQTIKFVLPIIGTFGFYIGFAIGGGHKLSTKIESGDFKVNRIIEFTEGDTKKAKLIGLNNQYIFYVLEGDKKVSISPISGNIKTITSIQN